MTKQYSIIVETPNYGQVLIKGRVDSLGLVDYTLNNVNAGSQPVQAAFTARAILPNPETIVEGYNKPLAPVVSELCDQLQKRDSPFKEVRERGALRAYSLASAVIMAAITRGIIPVKL